MICPKTHISCFQPDCVRDGCFMVSRESKPTMAEIERLVDAFHDAANALNTSVITGDRPKSATDSFVAARAALLAAIRAYVEGK